MVKAGNQTDSAFVIQSRWVFQRLNDSFDSAECHHLVIQACTVDELVVQTTDARLLRVVQNHFKVEDTFGLDTCMFGDDIDNVGMMTFLERLERLKAFSIVSLVLRLGFCLGGGLALSIEFGGDKSGDWEKLSLFVEDKVLLPV